MVNNGGPAFPNPYQLAANQGMTMRDYFAAKAMQGILSDTLGAGLETFNVEARAKMAYRMADAMLAVREGGSDV